MKFERKNLKSTTFKDYMKLNSDGSGLFTVAKMEGRYEAKVEEAVVKNSSPGTTRQMASIV